MTRILHQLQQAPAWLLVVVAAITLLTTLGMTYKALGTAARAGWRAAARSRRAARKRQEQEAPGTPRRTALAVVVDSWTLIVGAGGMTVSMWGLVRFAQDEAQLPALLRFGFVGILDGAELGLFLGLYLAARQGASRVTEPMRRSHRLAWRLVMLSAAAQIAEAHGTAARVAMGIVPVLSAALIDHRLQALMSDNRTDADQDGDGQPGPLRLVALLWRRAWAGTFGRLGLDASGTRALTRRAQVQRAARLTYEHRQALAARNATPEGSRARRRAEARAGRLRLRAQTARQRAAIPTDDAQRLDYMRELASLVHGDEWAGLKFEDSAAVHAFIDKMAIADNPDLISAQARAEDAERARRDAEERKHQAEEEAEHVREEAARLLAEAERKREAAEQAEDARQRAEDARKAAESQHHRLADEIAQLEERAERLRQSADATDEQKREAANAIERMRTELRKAEDELNQRQTEAETARREAEEARTARRHAVAEAEEATHAVRQLTERAQELRQQIEDGTAERQRQAEEMARLQGERQRVEEAARQEAAAAAAAREEARQAAEERRAALLALRQAREELLDALTDPEAQQAPQWRSEAKLRGWELYYRLARTEGREPTDAELATAGGRDESTARHWTREFRRELARLTAAALPVQDTAHHRTAEEAAASNRPVGEPTAPESATDATQSHTGGRELAAA
ncbi:hypothetical protein ACWDBD_46935 [Streptomyces sp. NPDC001118]